MNRPEAWNKKSSRDVRTSYQYQPGHSDPRNLIQRWMDAYWVDFDDFGIFWTDIMEMIEMI